MSDEKLNPSVVGDKVYVVTSGAYSDYHIDCVFRTREEAEGWVSKRWSPGCYDIEEWSFDQYNPSQLAGFEIHMDLETGEVKHGYEIRHEGSSQMRVEYRTPNPKPTWERFDHYFGMTVACLARDKDHAIKIASEMRRQVLASPLFDLWKNSPDPSAMEMKWNESLSTAPTLRLWR